MSELPIVEVLWEDSTGKDGWQLKASAEGVHPFLLLSVGYVLKDDKEMLLIVESQPAADINPEYRSWGCVNSIPRSAIRKVTYLRGRKPRR